MARRPRERSAAGFYHVYSRGTGGLVLFEDDADHHAQYALYGRAVQRHGWKIHAHCLMRTHHHVLVEAPHEALVRGMHLLGTTQAMRLNKRRERFGHATAGRFGSSALHTHAEVARVAAYIAVNPVEAGIVDDPGDFHWTSHRATLGVEPAPVWLDNLWLPEVFRTDSLRGVEAYERCVDLQAATIVAARRAT
jgi:REP element-mobilizing transposase RayT